MNRPVIDWNTEALALVADAPKISRQLKDAQMLLAHVDRNVRNFSMPDYSLLVTVPHDIIALRLRFDQISREWQDLRMSQALMLTA